MPTRYPNSPVTEAIIDLRVKLAEGVDRALLKQVGDAEQGAYPTHEEVAEAIGPSGGPASAQQTPTGWKFISEVRKQIVQCRVNGFTFSKLAPYDGWEPFRDETRRLWKIYREILSPESILRLTVRYVHRIDIPGDSVELMDYFRTAPEIAPDLPQQLEGYFMQLRLPFPDISGHCVINQTIVPPAREGVVSVVLDLDLYRARELPQDEPSIWSCLTTLQEEKTRVFESCITDLTRRLFSCQS